MTMPAPQEGKQPLVRCSDVAPEPLPGTAKQAGTYVIFEWPLSWSHDVLDGGTLGEEFTARLKAHLKKYGASLQLIRHPTRERRQITDHHLYLVFAEDNIMEVTHVSSPEELLELDLSGPGRNNLEQRTHPLVLICTHAKRDACCAIKGRPLVTELEKRYPFSENGDIVWETSHTKGHRFAPSMLLMPWGYSFGRMNVEATESMIEASLQGAYFIAGNRGRGTLTPTAQVAELAVASELALAHEPVKYGQFDVVSDEIAADAKSAKLTVVDTASGRNFAVTLASRTVDGIISSCGAEPKRGNVWDVDSVEEAVN
ncbi:sucrase ferredoxin [Corynebacterium lubricantis]|uniref:sucrase ferredoxin n=1 Tax=Corynebacterium lubricantis TaxID=541095 RepID=UPI000369B918|nr:sucrase ferredoxin [Corynebacterium lubricantis]